MLQQASLYLEYQKAKGLKMTCAIENPLAGEGLREMLSEAAVIRGITIVSANTSPES